ncbi:hypothetical protein DEO72_LG10g3549 [Vigna unguiculata]|uniref:Uncharacterized protein n=1 Tax=Vigna unguiculata TaxID=3917 RepID=A0A4D6NK92_VIGUN|nr:hypothetical protein DEO72_LG10g3549 [Vigna unguiculata]
MVGTHQSCQSRKHAASAHARTRHERKPILVRRLSIFACFTRSHAHSSLTGRTSSPFRCRTLGVTAVPWSELFPVRSLPFSVDLAGPQCRSPGIPESVLRISVGRRRICRITGFGFNLRAKSAGSSP